MKLILCRKCQDVYKLGRLKDKKCTCGATGGRYLKDGLHAEIWGDDAVPLGFANSSLVMAIQRQPASGWGKTFEAFVIAKECDTVKVIEPPKKTKKVKTK